MLARHLFACFILLTSLPAAAIANSYAFGPLSKDDLPAKASKFSSWITSYGKEQDKQLSRESLNRFLEHGSWHYHNPYYVAMKALGPDWNQYHHFGKLPENERSEKQQLILDTHAAYNQKPEIRGAFTDDEGKVFLFRLRSPQFLEIQAGGGICYLFLKAEKQIELDAAGDDRVLTEVPDLNVASVSISRGPLPATGSFARIPEDLLKAFLKKRHGIESKDHRLARAFFEASDFLLAGRSSARKVSDFRT